MRDDDLDMMPAEELMSFYEDTLKFNRTAFDALDAGGRKRGVEYKFICPLCGGEAIVTSSVINGQTYAHCSKCEVGFIEQEG